MTGNLVSTRSEEVSLIVIQISLLFLEHINKNILEIRLQIDHHINHNETDFVFYKTK